MECTSANTCSTCVTTENRGTNCTCASGYYDNGSYCEKCHYKCKECSGSYDTCADSCSDPLTRDFS